MWSEELDVRPDPTVADLDHIYQLSEYSGAGEPREDFGAPVHRRLGSVDHQRQDFFVAELERLDHDGKERTILVCTARLDGYWCRVACACNLESRIRRELVIYGSNVAAHPSCIEVAEQPFGLLTIGNRVTLRH